MSTPELFTEPQHVRGDLQQVAQAVKRGWKIPDVMFEKAGEVIAKIMVKGTPREQVAAMKCLLAMNEQNTPKAQQTQVVNVGVHVDNRTTDDRRNRTLAIAERIRAERISADADE